MFAVVELGVRSCVGIVAGTTMTLMSAATAVATAMLAKVRCIQCRLQAGRAVKGR